MKSTTQALVIFLLLLSTNGFAQEKSKKQLKEERKIEERKQTEALVNSKTFIFIGKIAYPQGFKSVNLTTNTNFVRFSPEFIESYMPFFGKAYSGIGLSGDGGLKFEGKPEKFTIMKGKRDFQIDAEVKTNNDRYRLSLSVGLEGGFSSLTIISNNRSSISYNGEIIAPDQQKDKK